MIDHKKVKLGKREAKRDRRNLKIEKYFLPELQLPPPAVDWLGSQAEWGEMLNDRLGDCVWAGMGHSIQMWSKNDPQGLQPGQETITVTDAAILADYEACCGYVDGDSSTDNGCVILDALNFWRKNPIEGHHLLAYATVDPQNLDHVRQTIQLFGVCYIGVGLPLTAMNQPVWEVRGNPVAEPNARPWSWGGHCVAVGKYDDAVERFTGITWGEPMEMTYDFFTTYCDEAYALLGGWWVRPDHAPQGFNFHQLNEDLAAVTS